MRQCTEEVATLRKENNHYRDQERALELKLAEAERMRDQYMQKYNQFKNENQTLKTNLAEVTQPLFLSSSIFYIIHRLIGK